ncbi:hypothetical protein ACJZ2D_008038 [Fusarium nematophilum]
MRSRSSLGLEKGFHWSIGLFTTTLPNNRFFTNAITNLLIILSAGNDMEHKHGITLELSAHSPSDFEHMYRNVKPADDYPFITEDDLADTAAFDEYNKTRCLESARILDIPHGFMGDGRRETPTDDAVKRFRGSGPLSFIFSDQENGAGALLQPVRFVKQLVIRRHSCRNFSPRALAELLKSFVKLEMLRDEQSRPAQDEQNESDQNLYFDSPHKAAPSSLQRLYLYRDIAHDFPLHMTPVVKHLARVSQDLKERSISSEADAQGFLDGFYPAALKGDPDQDPNNQILRAAAVNASCMPKLETMELWQGSHTVASIFRYSTKNNSPTITWQSTWKESLQGDQIWTTAAVKEWEKTADRHCSRVLDIKWMPLPE